MICITSALFLGRFQPFHLGHLNDVKIALHECDELIIAVGSSENRIEKHNPFIYEERKHMISAALQEERIENYQILGVPDINDDAKYVAHTKRFVPSFDKVYTGSKNTKKLFEEAGYKVVFVKLFQDIHATFVRECMAKGSGWELLVPRAVHDYILEIDGVNRVKNLYT